MAAQIGKDELFQLSQRRLEIMAENLTDIELDNVVAILVAIALGVLALLGTLLRQRREISSLRSQSRATPPAPPPPAPPL